MGRAGIVAPGDDEAAVVEAAHRGFVLAAGYGAVNEELVADRIAVGGVALGADIAAGAAAVAAVIAPGNDIAAIGQARNIGLLLRA